MNSNTTKIRRLGSLAGIVLLALLAEVAFITPAHADTLYIGDGGNNSIKSFDASSGNFLGSFVKESRAGLKGPRGLVFNPDGNLIVSDQNVNTSALSDILLYSGQTGKLLDVIVADDDPNAPATSRGIVLTGGYLLVASMIAETNAKKPATPGKLLKYASNGQFIADLTPDSSDFPASLPAEFHPRALVVGPDSLLYVSNFANLATGLGGQVLRFNADGSFHDVFINDLGGVGKLNRPEGLVFGPDGNLYITSFRSSASDIDSIRVYNGGTGDFIENIPLDVAGQSRAFAQALLFGPAGKLFVPITGNGPDTGAVRRYDVSTHDYDNFIPPAAQGGPLGFGWYLTFGNTDSATLEYIP